MPYSARPYYRYLNPAPYLNVTSTSLTINKHKHHIPGWPNNDSFHFRVNDPFERFSFNQVHLYSLHLNAKNKSPTCNMMWWPKSKLIAGQLAVSVSDLVWLPILRKPILWSWREDITSESQLLILGTETELSHKDNSLANCNANMIYNVQYNVFLMHSPYLYHNTHNCGRLQIIRNIKKNQNKLYKSNFIIIVTVCSICIKNLKKIARIVSLRIHQLVTKEVLSKVHICALIKPKYCTFFTVSIIH